jgi:hypothetical protein
MVGSVVDGGRLDNSEYRRRLQEAQDALGRAVSLSIDQLALERRRQFPDPRKPRRRQGAGQPRNSVILTCSGTGKRRHSKVVLSTPLRPWTHQNSDPAVIAYGVWPTSQERWPKLGQERWRWKCPACPVTWERREPDLAWIVLGAIAAGISELDVTQVPS